MYIASRRRPVTGSSLSGKKSKIVVVGLISTQFSRRATIKKGKEHTLVCACSWWFSAKHLFLSTGFRCRTLLSGQHERTAVPGMNFAALCRAGRMHVHGGSRRNTCYCLLAFVVARCCPVDTNVLLYLV